MAVKKPYLIAIDFDSTLCKGGWPDISKGEIIESTVDIMQAQLTGKPNTVFILWTCRAGDKLEDAKRFIEQHDLPIYYFNEQHPSVFEWMQDAVDTRKVYADQYWDDRAVTMPPLYIDEEED